MTYQRYNKSNTKIHENTVSRIAAKYNIRPWCKRGDVRFYLNTDALADIIGLDQDFYKSGSCCKCHYIDIDGEDVQVAHSRCYGEGRYSCKTYISGGVVFCDWAPYDANIAELVAQRVNEIFA